METRLKINGMNCEACAAHVTNALQKVAGVTRADVDLQTASAIVEHEGTSTEALQNAVAEEGYEARVA
jgi:mercuric reductase